MFDNSTVSTVGNDTASDKCEDGESDFEYSCGGEGEELSCFTTAERVKEDMWHC
jgi:hypothetical protein